MNKEYMSAFPLPIPHDKEGQKEMSRRLYQRILPCLVRGNVFYHDEMYKAVDLMSGTMRHTDGVVNWHNSLLEELRKVFPARYLPKDIQISKAHITSHDGPGIEFVTSAIILPAVFPVKNESNEAALESMALTLGIQKLGVDLSLHSIARLMLTGMPGERMSTSTREQEERMQILQRIMEQEQEDIIPRDEQATKTFYYLGYESQEEFARNIETNFLNSIDGMYEEGDQKKRALARISSALRFAQTAYSLVDKPARKSGEPYYFHAYRVAWYLLGYLEKNKIKPNNPEELATMIECALLHDVHEDLTPKRKGYDKSKNFSGYLPVHGEIDSKVYDLTIRDVSNNETYSYRVTERQKMTLDALCAQRDSTYLRDSIEKDPTGLSALIKHFDRLDNLLTYPQKSWTKMTSKLLESFAGMGRTAIHGLSGTSMRRRIKYLNNMILTNTIPFHMPGSVLSYVMYLHCSSKLKRRFVEAWKDVYESDSPLDNAEILADMQTHEKQRMMLDDIYNALGLHYMVRGYQSSSEEVNRLFGYEDIAQYLEHTYKLFIASKAHVNLEYPVDDVYWEM